MCVCVCDLTRAGLPPLTHTDEAKRAVRAAQLLVEYIAAFGPAVHSSVGVASGLCFDFDSFLFCFVFDWEVFL